MSLVSLVLIMLVVLYFNLGTVINVERLKSVLDSSEIFKSYSWSKGSIIITNKGLLSKNIAIDFRNFCFDYQKEEISAQSCFTEISLKLSLNLVPPFIVYHTPLTAHTELLSLIKLPREDESPGVGENQEIDVNKYYSYLWHNYFPSLDINLKKIAATIEEKKFSFPFKLTKNLNTLSAESSPFHLFAQKEVINIFTGESLLLPIKGDQLNLKKAALTFKMNDEIMISSSGQLEFIEMKLQSKMPALFETQKMEEVISSLLKNLDLFILIPSIKKNLAERVKGPYGTLPAPFNEMEGDITFRFGFKELGDYLNHGRGELLVDLKSERQVLNLSIIPEIKVSAKDFSYHDLSIDMVFNKVLIELPKFSKKSLPPQVLPDSRFQSSKDLVKAKEKKGPPFKLDVLVKAEKENSLQLKTNFIEEMIKLNFSFNIVESELLNGYIRLLPMDLTVLRRPIRIEDLWLNLKAKKIPELNSTIFFNLPEYKIKLLVQGPISTPRYMFESEPPLPQDDIYSVLLFGRPLNDMGPDSNSATEQTRQLLSQGLLSLSVLYVLSGTPIEYIGYDAQNKEASAQIGLGAKNSLRVSSGERGNQTGVRRSLGKGWYIDSSVLSPSSSSSSNNKKANDYGVFLERIISY